MCLWRGGNEWLRVRLPMVETAVDWKSRYGNLFLLSDREGVLTHTYVESCSSPQQKIAVKTTSRQSDEPQQSSLSNIKNPNIAEVVCDNITIAVFL